MESAVIMTLLNNIALLLAMSVAYEMIYFLPLRLRRFQSWITGFAFSVICFAIMNMPFTLQQGLFYDTRSVLISVTALLFGWIPTIMIVVTAIAFRLSVGGVGVYMGVAVILSSAAIGLIWRRWIYPKAGNKRWISAFFMGVVVHIAMLCCTLFLPDQQSFDVMRNIALPVMLFYPIGSILLCMLLVRQMDHKSMQDRLKQSEERFKMLFDQAPLGYQSLDADGNFIEVNWQWLDMLGYEKDEVIGKWFGDFVAPESRQDFIECFPVFKSQGQIHSEFTMIQKNGSEVFIAFDGKIGYNENGSFLQTHCILQNVTQQRITEKKLSASEEKHRRLFETMSLGVVYQSADGKIILVNPAAERILGRNFEEMSGTTSMSSTWKSLREDGSEIRGDEHPAMIALKSGKPVGPSVFGIYNPKFNDYVWISINAIPLFRSGEEEPHQVYTIFQDITAERKANRNYYLLFHQMVDAFALHEIILDESGEPVDYRFLAVNGAFESMTGLKAADIIGKTVLEVLPGTEPYWIETYGRVAFTGKPIRFENYSADIGKHFMVSAYQPAPKQFACTFSDVTQRVKAEQEAQSNMSRLRGLLDNSPSPIMILDEEGVIIETSPATETILEFIGANDQDQAGRRLAPPVIRERIKDANRQISGKNPFLERLDVFEKAGIKLCFESRMFPIFEPKQKKLLFGYLAVDVTDNIAAELALKESEEKYSNYIENAPYGVFVVDETGRYVDANPAATLLTGYDREHLMQMTIKDFVPENSVDVAINSIQTLKATGKLNTELQYIHADGSIRWWTVNSIKLSEERYLCFSTDVTEKKNAEAEMIFLSNHDYLTSLYNRRYFEKELTRLDQTDNMPLTVIIGDINGVKLVNDAFGHAEGDRLICECASIIKDCCRTEDTLARVGGDEFGIIMTKTDNAAALGAIMQIQSALKKFDDEKTENHFQHSVALGFGIKKASGEDLTQIMKIAEEYMYQRKLLAHNSSHSTIIASIKATMFEKSHETEEHAERLVLLSRMIADSLHLNQGDRDRLELLATLHDIGKVAISDSILTKPDKLTEDEWTEMKRHPEIGYRIAMSSPDLMPVAEGILCHQERWNGSGYPQALQGEEIPLLSRIIAIVDAYDAMTQDRPYQSAMTHEEAIAEIERCAGTQFDPEIARIFVERIGNNDQIEIG